MIGLGRPPLTLGSAIVVADGNSITNGFSHPGESLPDWPTQLKTRPSFSPVEVFNVAVSGQTTSQMTGRYSSMVQSKMVAGKSHVLIAWEIRNDIFFGGSVSAACSNFEAYCKSARSNGWRVIALTPPPANQSTAFGDTPTIFQSKLTQSGNWLRSNWQGFANALVDIDTIPSLANASTYPDGVHPTRQQLVSLVDRLEVVVQKTIR